MPASSPDAPALASCLQSLSYVSPQAILNALLPQAQLPAAAAETGGDGGRVAAFKRYIAGTVLDGSAGGSDRWFCRADALFGALAEAPAAKRQLPPSFPTAALEKRRRQAAVPELPAGPAHYTQAHCRRFCPCLLPLQTLKSAAAAPRCQSSLLEPTG